MNKEETLDTLISMSEVQGLYSWATGKQQFYQSQIDGIAYKLQEAEGERQAALAAAALDTRRPVRESRQRHAEREYRATIAPLQEPLQDATCARNRYFEMVQEMESRWPTLQK